MTYDESRTPPNICFGEIFQFAYDTFCSNKVRFALTALGMVIGTASLILVVTIGLTGKTYVLNQIQAIGSNLVYAEYESGPQRLGAGPLDPLTIDDMNAVQQQVPGITAATPVVNLNDRIAVGVIDTLRRAGVAVPNDVSVAGYDDSTLAKLGHIDLTTVSQQPREQADRAIDAVVSRLDAARTEPLSTVLAPQLIVRTTTAPPGSAATAIAHAPA